MEKSLTNSEDDTATVEFGLVTSLCLRRGPLGNSFFGNVVRVHVGSVARGLK